MKKIPGENLKRKPEIGDLVKFDITWCEGLGPLGNDYVVGGSETLMQYGIVTSIDSREAYEGQGFRRTWDRYFIMWKGINLMYFGSEKLIEVVEDNSGQ